MPANVEYDPDSDTYRLPLDGSSGRSTVGMIADAVAEVDGVDPTDLAPISGRLDPDALEDLLASPGDESTVSVTFSYWGFRITVSPGEAVLTPDGRAHPERHSRPGDRPP